jgi:hypothetical protein
VLSQPRRVLLAWLVMLWRVDKVHGDDRCVFVDFRLRLPGHPVCIYESHDYSGRMARRSARFEFREALADIHPHSSSDGFLLVTPGLL